MQKVFLPFLRLQEHRQHIKHSATGKQGALSAGRLLIQVDIVWVRNDYKYMRHTQKIIGCLMGNIASQRLIQVSGMVPLNRKSG